MASLRKARIHAGGVAALVVVAVVVAGCGSSSSSSSAPAPAPAPAPTATNAAATSAAGGSSKRVSVSLAKGTDGTYLAGASGRALYLWVADSNGKSSCAGSCAKAWPPLLTKSAPMAAHGVQASDLGTITRADGTKQVTYKGHPLYYFVEDSSAGMTHGQGSDSFGAKWWLVAPSGSAIMAGGSSANAASGGSSSSSSGSSGGGGSSWG
jgi:predicted lipoprotein with Yx(FWY)xxD motif